MLKTHDARAHALEGVTLFRGCSKKELQALARITTEVAVPEGRILCREGEYGQECFIVIVGEAGVTIGFRAARRCWSGARPRRVTRRRFRRRVGRRGALVNEVVERPIGRARAGAGSQPGS